MNKTELISKIAEDTGLSKVSAAAAVDSFIEGITKSLKKGQPITFVGFGTFKTAQRKARTARNPQTGASIKIPKRRVVRFSAGKALKTALNGTNTLPLVPAMRCASVVLPLPGGPQRMMEPGVARSIASRSGLPGART